jgi:hypothetical protein
LSTPLPPYKPKERGTNSFRKEFISAFESHNPISIDDIELERDLEFDKYVRDLYIHLQKKNGQFQKIDHFLLDYNRFKSCYLPRHRWLVYTKAVEHLIRLDQYERALVEWLTLREEEYNSQIDFTYRDNEVFELMRFEKLLNRSVVSGPIIRRIAFTGNQLTKFGKRNINEVLQVASVQIESSPTTSFFSPFYRDFTFETSENSTPLCFADYESFFQHDEKARKIWAWVCSKEAQSRGNLIDQFGNGTKTLLTLAVRQEASRLLRDAENEYRLIIGAKKIGEAWISETELYYKLKTQLSQFAVIHHGRPPWLGRQHFDIWIPALNVAIEFQGVQHDEPIPHFGGKEAFENNQKRDALKKSKCKEMGVRLLEVREGYDLNTLLVTILGTL